MTTTLTAENTTPIFSAKGIQKITGSHSNTSSLVTHTTPLLCHTQTVNPPTLENQVKGIFLDVHYFLQTGREKNKKININGTVQIDHFSNELWVSSITHKSIKTIDFYNIRKSVRKL